MSVEQRPEQQGTEQGTDVAASLLAAGRREVRAPQAATLEARILAATGYATAATLATNPTLWARLFKVLGAKGIVGVSVVALAASGVAVARYASTPATHVDAPAIVMKTPTREAPHSPAIVANQQPSIAVEDLPVSAAPVVPVAKIAAPSSSIAHVAQDDSDTIAAETAAIDHARHTLASGDTGGALREIDAYEHKFPSAFLGEEMAFLRVQSLDRAGRTSEARASAATFLTRYPSSPYAERAKQIGGRAEAKDTP